MAASFGSAPSAKMSEGNLSDAKDESVVSLKKKPESRLFDDIVLIFAAGSIFFDSNQFHQPAQLARHHGGYWFYLVCCIIELFVIFPILSIFLHCANFTAAGISKFPHLYGQIFGFVSCGFVAVSLLQQSAAIATASSHIAWVAHLENGSYELTHCHTLLNDTKGDRCTSISHYKACKNGRVWTVVDGAGGCTFGEPDVQLIPSSSLYYNKYFDDEQGGSATDRKQPVDYQIAYATTWGCVLIVMAGITFAGVKWMSLLIGSLTFVVSATVIVTFIYIIVIGNVNQGHSVFLSMSQLQHLLDANADTDLTVCNGQSIAEVPNSYTNLFPYETIQPISCGPFLLSFSFPSLAFLRPRFGRFDHEGFLHLREFCYHRHFWRIFFTLFLQHRKRYSSGIRRHLPGVFGELVISEMFAISSSDAWMRMYYVTAFLADLPRISMPFYLCHAVSRDHFPKRNKWLCLSLSVAAVVVFQTIMYFYFWKVKSSMKVLTSVCGFYGMSLIAGLMIITVIVYGPMELELDVDGMAANWRMRRFWRKLIVPFCVFMVNNLVIPIVFFLAIPRIMQAIMNAMVGGSVSGANLSVCCAPGLLMLGWLIYDIGVLISKKKLNQRAFYPMPAHPSYQRVVIETNKKIKIRKARNSKEKTTAM